MGEYWEVYECWEGEWILTAVQSRRTICIIEKVCKHGDDTWALKVVEGVRILNKSIEWMCAYRVGGTGLPCADNFKNSKHFTLDMIFRSNQTVHPVERVALRGWVNIEYWEDEWVLRRCGSIEYWEGDWVLRGRVCIEGMREYRESEWILRECVSTEGERVLSGCVSIFIPTSPSFQPSLSQKCSQVTLVTRLPVQLLLLLRDA